MRGERLLEVAHLPGRGALAVARRRSEQDIVPGLTAGAAGDERSPLARQVGLAAALGQFREQTGLRRDLMTHAELVEVLKPAFDVPVRTLDIAFGVGEQAFDPLRPTADESVTAVLGMVTG